VPTNKKNPIRITAATLLAAGGITFAAAGSASAAAQFPEFEIKIEPQAIERTVEVTEQRREYRQTWETAKKLDVEPENAALNPGISPADAKAKVEDLEQKVKKAQQPEFGTPESVGVSSSTLEAIASCESGGDPTAVDASGTYRGKYQFDTGTWASVGGSGDPAAAPEAEQDYRAALLYSQAGSSPWPICGS
jgi:hypothetical protein